MPLNEPFEGNEIDLNFNSLDEYGIPQGLDDGRHLNINFI